MIRAAVGLFVFTLFFAVGVKARSGEMILHFGGTVAILLGIGSTVAFLFLIDYTARLLRPVSIVWRIGEQGIKVIETVYRVAIKDPHVPTMVTPRPDQTPRVIAHQGSSAIVLAVNLRALVAAARAAEGVIEFVHRVGDFVATGEPLFRVYGGNATLDSRLLRAQVAFGRERTIEQDLTFAFRVIVDVAIKALSKAINDPTTAVLALDQLHRLLRLVGRRHLHNEALFDADRKLRLIFPTPNWADFVQLTFREIRLYGAENFQVARRLHAMIENLIATLRRHGIRRCAANWTCWIGCSRNFMHSQRTWHWHGSPICRDWAVHRRDCPLRSVATLRSPDTPRERLAAETHRRIDAVARAPERPSIWHCTDATQEMRVAVPSVAS